MINAELVLIATPTTRRAYQPRSRAAASCWALRGAPSIIASTVAAIAGGVSDPAWR